MKKASEIACRHKVLIALDKKREVKRKQKEVKIGSRGSFGFRLADYKRAEDERKEWKEVGGDVVPVWTEMH